MGVPWKAIGAVGGTIATMAALGAASKMDFASGVEEADDDLANRMEERVTDARIRMSGDLNKFPFFGGLLRHLTPVVTRDPRIFPPNIQTMAVDAGDNLYIFPEFADSLTDGELEFVLAHEVLHVAYGISARRGFRDPRLTNMAHDHVINLQIIETGKFPVPQIGILADERFTGLSFEEVYDLLEQEQSNKEKGKPAGGGNGPPSPQEQAARDSIDQADAGQWGIGDDIREGDAGSPAGEGESKQGQIVPSTDQEKRQAEKWKRRIAQELQQAQRRGSPVGGSIGMKMKELVEATLDWRVLLREFTGRFGRKTKRTFKRRGRRSGVVPGGFVRPGKIQDLPPMAIIVDTSGSMQGSFGLATASPISQVLGEVQRIVEELGTPELRIIGIDTQIHADMKNPTDINEVIRLLEEQGGGGGSDLRPAFELLVKEQYRGPLIVATDGGVTVPDTQPQGMKVLFLIPADSFPGKKPTEGGAFGGGKPLSWGETIFIRRDGQGRRG